jgi:hypothetical protein
MGNGAKLRGKVHFFGVWENPQAALQSYHAVAADLHAGRQPSVNVAQDAITVKHVCDHYRANASNSKRIAANFANDTKTETEITKGTKDTKSTKGNR